MSNPLKAFITYSHKDLQRNTELQTRLAVMEDEGKIKLWDDNKILPSDEWEKDISDNLAESDILLYLVSATSLASKNCNKELTEILSPNIRVIPIILEACDWENHQLSRFEALPHKGKPINEWRPQSKGWQNVVTGIRKVVGTMQSQTDSVSGAFEDQLLAELAFQQGNVFMMFGQIDLTIEAYSYAIKLNPNDAEVYNNRGVAYSNKNDFDRATEDFTKAIQLNPSDAGAYNNRGVAYLNESDFNRAIEDYTKAIQLKPDYSSAYNNRGVAYRYKGDFNHAIEDCTKAIQLNPSDAGAYNNRGIAYSDKGDYDRAIADYIKAIQLNPNYVDAYYNRGKVYSEQSDYDRAIADYTRAIQLEPDYAGAYNNRGIAYESKGDYSCAIEDYTKAIQLKPDHADAYYNRGDTYGIKGDYSCATEDFTKVIQLNPDDAGTYFMRGVAWLHLREWAKAKSDLATTRDMGINIIAAFHSDYGSVADFERITGIQLPADIAAMLTPQEAAIGEEAEREATHESENDFETVLDKIVRKYDRAWKTLAKP